VLQVDLSSLLHAPHCAFLPADGVLVPTGLLLRLALFWLLCVCCGGREGEVGNLLFGVLLLAVWAAGGVDSRSGGFDGEELFEFEG